MKDQILSFFYRKLRRTAEKEHQPTGKDSSGGKGGPCHSEGVRHVSGKADGRLLTGKNVLITGAGRNIGRSIAIEMVEQGANIFFTDIELERCKKLTGELRGKEGMVRYFLSDVSKTADVDSLCQQLREESIHLDVLVNNVGIQCETKHREDLHMDDLYKVFHTNVFGPLYLTKCAVQMMTADKIAGSILFITSIHESVLSRWLSYSASKAALRMIIRELAMDLASHGIRVNGIAPGWVAEDDSGKTLDFGPAPLHHTSINPCYIGRAAVYLSSEYFSRFTTGTIITVDAGLSLHSYLTLRDR